MDSIINVPPMPKGAPANGKGGNGTIKKAAPPKSKMPLTEDLVKATPGKSKMQPAAMPVKTTSAKFNLSASANIPSFDMNTKKKSALGNMPKIDMLKSPALKGKVGRPEPHVFQKPDADNMERLLKQVARAEGKVGFDYPATLRGSTANFNVYYDPGLGANGPIIADGVLASCENEYAYLQVQFGGISAGPFNIIIAAGIGGAYHYGCSATDIYCDADTSASPDVDHTRMLVVAEEVEVFSAVQNMGWNCAASNGEGISRILATELYPAELDGFTSAAAWLDAAGRPDFVNVNDPTDRNYLSIGCSVLFLNYLHYQLAYSWTHIVCAGGATLAETYTRLTGRTDGLERFKALLQIYFPEGTPSHVTTDNVFPLGTVDSGRLEIFARGGDGALWHNWQTAPNNGWSDWASLGGWISEIAVGQNADGRLEIFAIGADNALWHIWETGAGWSDWASLGGWIDMLTVSQNADGRMEVFARGGDGAVWHMWQTAPNNGWSSWDSLGGWIDRLAVGQNADGRMEIFARGSDGAVWHNWQTAPSSGWSGWDSLGGWIDILTVSQNADGRLEVFARGSDGAVWHNWQTAPNNGWSGWASLGGWIDILSIGQNADGRMEIFARGGDGAVWHNWQVEPNSGWSGWASLGGWIDKLSVNQNQDGRMEVFARGSDGAVWHNWQTAPNNGWSGWASLGGWIDILTVGKNRL